MKKILILGLVLLMTITLTVGCKDKQQEENDTPNDGVVDETNEPSESNEIETKGKYIGLIDNNSVEIEVDGEPMAFRLSEDIKEELANTSGNENTEVNIKYEVTDENQKLLTSLDFVKEVIKGKYIGQIDNNSVEIEVDGEIGAYRLSEDVKTYMENNQIEDGSTIEFTTIVNEYDQLVITSIKKAK